MRRITARLGLAACIGLLGASAPAHGQQESAAFQIRADEIVLPDGSRIADGLLRVEGGRIARVVRLEGEDEPDPALPLVEHDGVLTAGMVACQSQSGLGAEANDDTRAFLARARLIHGFDPEHSDFAKALAAGITTLVLVPNGDNVVGGLTAVVKTHGGGVLAEEGHLALSFAGAALGRNAQPAFFFFGAAHEPATADGGPENTDVSRRGSRAPTSYAGALRLLHDHFDDASDDGPYARAARGELPVFVEARQRHEVQRAVAFATERGLEGVVFGAPLFGDPALVGPLAESGLGVIVGPYSVGQLAPSLRSVKALQEAGVPVAFALGAPLHDPEALRLSAALALAAGADAAGTWRGLTSDAARLAGVDARVGGLEPGKDADLVLWSGDPLNLASRVEAVYAEGALVYSAPAKEPAKEKGGSSR